MKRRAAPANTTRQPPRGRDAIVTPVTLIVGLLLLGSVWVSGTAIAEKIRLSRGLQQIIGIVLTTREAAASDQRLGRAAHEDLLDDLARLRDYPVTGERDGLKTMINPWQGELTATTGDAGGLIRIESTVPMHICRRIIDLFGDDSQAFGVQTIEARRDGQAWRTVYTGPTGPGVPNAAAASDAEIAAACGTGGRFGAGSGGWSVIALSFGLR